MIELFTAKSPNGRKVSIALEELGVPYEIHTLDLGARDQLSASFVELNPNHKIPVIRDGDFVLWESGAILLYLAERFGALLPEAPEARYRAIQFAFFECGGVGPNVARLAEQLRRPIAERSREIVALFGEEVSRLLAVLDRLLSDDRPYIAGNYSIADIMLYPWLHPMFEMRAPPLLEATHVVAWLERVGARPAVARGMAVPNAAQGATRSLDF